MRAHEQHDEDAVCSFTAVFFPATDPYAEKHFTDRWQPMATRERSFIPFTAEQRLAGAIMAAITENEKKLRVGLYSN